MHFPPASVVSPPQHSSPPIVPSSVPPSVALKPAASTTPPCGSVIALLRERLACWYAEFAELDEAFLAHENCILELESSLAKSASGETSLRSQAQTLQTDLAATRADLTAS